LRGGGSRWRLGLAPVLGLDAALSQAGDRHCPVAAHHGRAAALRPGVRVDRWWAGRADEDAQSLHLSGSLPLRRSELCGRHLVVRAVRDGHVQHLVHQAHAARELGAGMTRSRASRIAQRIAAYVTIAVALILTLFPIYWIAANSLKLDIDIFAVPPEWFPF